MIEARILVTVVLYKMPITESQTIQGLLRVFASHPELHGSLSVLIWDNSPTPVDNYQSLSPFIYRHSQENLGVSGAYNRAMKIAEEMDCDWLLLLDQDTTIPEKFLQQMLMLGGKLLDKPEIAAAVPFLIDGDRVLSPFKVLFKRMKPIQRPFEGVYAGEVSAANSGMLLKLDALREIGGFNEDFWLDYSDIVTLHLLHEHGKKVYIAGDLLLQHKMAVIDFKESMSPERYSNFVMAEGAYWDAYGTAAEQVFHTLRIFERAIRQKRRFENPAYAKITFAYCFRRIFFGKKNRLKWWKAQALRARHSGAASSRSAEKR